MNPAPGQHTPGPWRAQINHCNHAVISTDGFDIALLRASDCDSEANARLIAAAPDLLAALEDILARYESAGVQCYPEARREVIAARAAIARATTGENAS